MTDTMRQLLDNKAKTKASKSLIETFNNEWFSYVNENGYDETAEDWLFKGFSYNGMVPFVKYIESISDWDTAVSQFFSGKQCHQSQNRFQMALHLLALLLETAPLETESVSKIIIRLPEMSLNQERKRRGTIGVFFKKYFLEVLNMEVELPALNTLDLRPADIQSFSDLIRDCLDSCKNNKLSQIDIQKLKIISEWSNNFEPATKYSETRIIQVDSKENTVKLPQEPIVETVSENYISEKNCQNKECAEKDRTIDESWETSLEIIQQTISRIEKENRKLIEENRVLRIQQITLSDEKLLTESRLTEERKASAVLKQNLTQSTGQISELRKEKTVLQNTVDLKDQEIAGEKKMAEIINRDKELHHAAVLKRIGSEIASYYSDFLVEENMEMTSELGEICRDQLRAIFKILKKRGIQVN